MRLPFLPLFFFTSSLAASRVKQLRPDPLLYFLSTPADFENDPDVCFMVMKLHTPATVETFYQTAAQTYTDLKHIFAEFARDREKAKELLKINDKIVEESFSYPLTVANVIFTAGKLIQPLLNYRSKVMDTLALQIRELEQSPSGTDTINTVVRFFRHFSLPEMQFIEILCNLMAQARLLKKPNSRGHIIDLSGTGLDPRYEKRILLTLANAFAKMDMLLTLFLTEPSAAKRSLNLVRKLWYAHWARWQEQNPGQALPKPPLFYDAQSYQKEPIYFTFPDWDEHVDVYREVSLLQMKREKLKEKFEAEEALRKLLQAKPQKSSAMMIFGVVFMMAVGVLAVTATYRVIKKQRELAHEF